MGKFRYQFAIAALVLGILACSSPSGSRSPSLAGTVEFEGGTPVPKVDAVAAMQTFAQEVLGLSIPNLKAGGTMGEVNLPFTTQDGMDLAFDMAGTTYIGFWNKGFGSLSVGDLTVTGDWAADVQDGSIGAFMVRQDRAVPSDAGTALDHIMNTFPGLNSYEFAETSIEEIDIKGFVFSAKQVDDIQIQSWNTTLTGTTIFAGITPGMQDGRSIDWVFVASGDLATALNQ